MSNPYYLRVPDRSLDRDALVLAAVDLGLLRLDGASHFPADPRISWAEVGTLTEPTGQLDADGQPIRAPITDANGTPYWHVNLLINGDITLMEWAQAARQRALDAGDQGLADRIAAHISGSAAFFPLDANGQPRKPNAPQVVFWT